MNEPYSCKAFLGEVLIRSLTDRKDLFFEEETALLINNFAGQEPVFGGLIYMFNNESAAVSKIMDYLSKAIKESSNSFDFMRNINRFSKPENFVILSRNIIAFLKERLENLKQKLDRSSETRWLDFWKGYSDFERDRGFIEFAYLMSKENVLREFFWKFIKMIAIYDGCERDFDEPDYSKDSLGADTFLENYATEALAIVLDMDEKATFDMLDGGIITEQIIDYDSFTMKEDVVKLLDMTKIIIP